MPPHTNHNAGSAGPETTTFAKSKRAWMTASAPLTCHTKNEATEAWRALRGVLTWVSRGKLIWPGSARPTMAFPGFNETFLCQIDKQKRT